MDKDTGTPSIGDMRLGPEGYSIWTDLRGWSDPYPTRNQAEQARDALLRRLNEDVPPGASAAVQSVPEPTEPMMKWFRFEHLPPHLQAASKLFHDLASQIANEVHRCPERTVALRKLLEAKDATVRAVIEGEESEQPEAPSALDQVPGEAQVDQSPIRILVICPNAQAAREAKQFDDKYDPKNIDRTYATVEAILYHGALEGQSFEFPAFAQGLRSMMSVDTADRLCEVVAQHLVKVEGGDHAEEARKELDWFRSSFVRPEDSGAALSDEAQGIGADVAGS